MTVNKMAFGFLKKKKKEEKDKGEYSKEEEEKVKERLKALGYL